MIELSPRLSSIFSLLDRVSVLADVGCDHGYILYKALEGGISERVIGIDISEPSLNKSKSLLSSNFSKERFECRLGNGLQVLGEREANGCVIAGMGGQLMAKILSESMDKAMTMDYLLLQPMQAEEELFTFLSKNHFSLLGKDLAREKDKYYPILKVAYTGIERNISWTDFSDTIFFQNFCQQNIKRLENIEKQIKELSKTNKRLESIKQEKARWEGYIAKFK